MSTLFLLMPERVYLIEVGHETLPGRPSGNSGAYTKAIGVYRNGARVACG